MSYPLPRYPAGVSRSSTSEPSAAAVGVARADAICTAATARFRAAEPKPGTELEAEFAWSKAAARASEKALAKLRALRAPEADRDRVTNVLSLMERQTDSLRELAAAASAGDRARVQVLSMDGIRRTHEKDELVYRLAALWGVDPEALYGRPVSLPA
jgi:hypothetical protein